MLNRARRCQRGAPMLLNQSSRRRRAFEIAQLVNQATARASAPHYETRVYVMTATQFSPRERVTEVVRRLLADRAIERSFTAEDDLREVGLTSLDMVNLVLSVESELAVRIPESDITPTNFRSVSSIEALVRGLRN